MGISPGLNFPPSPATDSTLGLVEAAANPASGDYPVVPIQLAAATETELTTTSATTLVSATPSAVGLVSVAVFWRIVTATTTISLSIAWTDAGGTAHTDTVLSGVSQAVGTYVQHTEMVSGADAITVSMTAGTASQVYASAALEGVS